MNPEAILSLISDLVSQITQQQQRIRELEAALSAQTADTPPERSEVVLNGD